MSKAPWFPLYAADFLTDSAAMSMTLEEFGAYCKLLMISWVNGGIPVSAARIQVLLNCDSTRMALLWPAIAAKWQPHPSDPSLMVNPRLEVERIRQQQMAAVKARAGQVGAKSRWGKEKSEMAEPLRPHRQNDNTAIVLPMAKNGYSQSQSQSTTPPTPPKGEETKPSLSRRGKTLCPDPFLITEPMAAFIRKTYPGIARAAVEAEHEKFLDWTRSQRPLKADWAATWRTWFRNAPSKSLEFRKARDAGAERARKSSGPETQDSAFA